MITLAFDTSLDKCSVAVGDDDKLLASSEVNVSRGHAELLMPIIQKTMAEANVAMNEIDRSAVVVGPGTFAGVRVSVAAANSLALALGCSVIGISTLEALVAKAIQDRVVENPGKKFTVFLSVGRANIFCQSFQTGTSELAKPLDSARRIERSELSALLDPPDLLSVLWSGLETSDLITGHMRSFFVEYNAETLLFWSKNLKMAKAQCRIEPVYLRPPDAKIGKRSFSPANLA